jgi:2-polyprenyl-3-methyl-5-hydroxy-6-metoxy-1,4-benzoquinol methylase
MITMTRNKEAKDYFSSKAKTYYEKHYGNPNNPKVYPNLYLRHRYILELIKREVIKGKTRVLDIGCGSGIMAKDLLNLGCNLWAADISQDMLNATKKTVGENKNIKYSIQDIENLKFKEKFDVVIASGVIEYLREDKLWIESIKNILKPNGILIVSIQNKIALPRIGVELADKLLPKFIRNKLFTLEQHKRHNPLKLDKLLRESKLKKIDHRYFHFYPFLIPFDKLFPRIYVWLGKKMEKFTKTNLGLFFATGYVIKAKFVK